jgi:hypothetical protein
MKSLVGPSNNYSGYRTEYSNRDTKLPIIPLQCVVLKDLVFIEESANVEEGNLNWWKFAFISDSMTMMMMMIAVSI